MRRINTHDYVDDFWPVDVDGSGTAEFVVYHYVSQKEGTYISVVDAEGERLRTWHEFRANRYSVCRWRSPSPELIASRDDAFTVRDTHGAILKRYVVAGAGSFRYVATGELAGGHRVLLATSGSCPARLLVFDSRDRLVYDERLARYASLLVPEPGADVFYVGIGGEIRRYSRGASDAAR